MLSGDSSSESYLCRSLSILEETNKKNKKTNMVELSSVCKINYIYITRYLKKTGANVSTREAFGA